jgi:hypothetical protein
MQDADKGQQLCMVLSWNDVKTGAVVVRHQSATVKNRTVMYKITGSICKCCGCKILKETVYKGALWSVTDDGTFSYSVGAIFCRQCYKVSLKIEYWLEYKARLLVNDCDYQVRKMFLEADEDDVYKGLLYVTPYRNHLFTKGKEWTPKRLIKELYMDL